MKLQMIWPESDHHITLDESVTIVNMYYFCLEQGVFFTEVPEPDRNVLRFYWHTPEPIMENSSEEYVCLVNEQPVQPGAQIPLRYGADIQAGHYRLMVKMPSSGCMSDVALPPAEMPVWPDDTELYELPEIETLLVHGGHYTGYLDRAEALQIDDQEPDVLKCLEFEYKRFLLWGEQSRELRAKEQHQETKLPARDSFLDNVTENVKDKTMTECIFDQNSLIERVIEELLVINQLDISEDDEHPDLLTVLAPGHIVRKEKRVVSSLIFQELYKLGLDSHL